MGNRPSLWNENDAVASHESDPISYFSKLAVFGNSVWALVASFFMLLLSIWVASLSSQSSMSSSKHVISTMKEASLSQGSSDTAIVFNSKGTTTGEIVTPIIMEKFLRDGVVAIRGILDEGQLDRLDVAAKEHILATRKKKHQQRRGNTQFFHVQVGLALTNPAFQDVALGSKLPSIASTFLQLSENSTLRLMRDILLVKDDDQYICGWHTDDTGFWPATGGAPGVNAWIALDDMPIHGGGGFALAVGSHTASWHYEADVVTGSTRTMPEEGFRDAADMFANRTGSGTCNIKKSAPHLHQLMEESMRVYDIKRGDVIFHDRWLYHRTIPFDKQFASQMQDPLYRRYSIRYGPGTSVIPPGYGLELSVLWDEKNAGRSADEVSALDGPWYPRCWPSIDSSEIAKLPHLVKDCMPVAEAARKARRKEMQPYLDQRRTQV